jgi:hypothetical protein
MTADKKKADIGHAIMCISSYSTSCIGKKGTAVSRFRIKRSLFLWCEDDLAFLLYLLAYF